MLTVVGLCATLVVPSAFAASDRDDSKRPYREHYQKWHMMNQDMMHMLSETMMILRDLNHRPTDKEKARLDDMIKQLDEMMKDHKDMMRYYDERRGDMMRDRDRDRMMDDRGGMMNDRGMMDDR